MFSPRTTTRFRAFAAAGACVAALGLAACGGDDDETTTTPTTEIGATGETDAASLDDADAGALRDQFNQQLITVLTTQQDLTQAQAECAIEELESSFSDDELQAAILEAADSGEAPQDLIDAGFEAGQACADAE